VLSPSTLFKVDQIDGPVDIDLSARKRKFDSGAGWIAKEETSTLVPAQCVKIDECAARKDGWNSARSGIGRSDTTRRSLRAEGLKQCAQVVGSEKRLIACQNQRAGNVGDEAFQRANAGMDGSCDSLTPCAIDHWHHILFGNGRPDLFVVCAEDHKQRVGACFLRQTHGALD